MIGKIFWSVFPFFDRKTNCNSFKKRPVLIISEPRNNDYTVLPISSVSIKSNVDSEYDVEIDVTKYSKLNLLKNCYIRTHKQTIVHKASLTSQISDLKAEYSDLYILILEKLELFNKNLMENAL